MRTNCKDRVGEMALRGVVLDKPEAPSSILRTNRKKERACFSCKLSSDAHVHAVAPTHPPMYANGKPWEQL